MGSFTGMRVLITGGSGGIGSATAKAFEREGALVAIVDMALRPTGFHGFFIREDARKQSAAESAVRRAVDEFGRINVLFNNCGVGANFPELVMQGTQEVNRDCFEEVMRINFQSALWFTQQATRFMDRSSRNCIITTSSVWAMGDHTGSVAYTASKAALAAVARSWAFEFAPIRSVVILPGAIRTPMFTGNAEETGKKILIGRIGEPEEVAQAVLFIASCELVNAIELVLDGGVKR